MYVHFNPRGLLADHVLHQLAALRPVCETIVVVSNSPLDDVDRARLDSHADVVIQRENVGFDFAAWRDGLNHLGWDTLPEYDSVTLMNDTCFGPAGDMGEVFATMEARGDDFWGMTNHRAMAGVPIGGVRTDVPEHLQSYFVSYARSTVQAPAFRELWTSVPDYTDVNDVVRNLEIRVTSRLVASGLRYGVVFDTRDVDYAPAPTPDFSYSLPDKVLAAGVPFVKLKAFLTRPEFAAFALQTMAARGYPVQLAAAHLSQVDRPDRTAYLAAKQGDYTTTAAPTAHGLRVAVHLHVHYLDLLDELLDALDTAAVDHGLIVTTDAPGKAAAVEEILARRCRDATVVVVPPRGRDIYPLLLVREHLAEYDVVGHFHTKKSMGDQEFVGETWRRELLGMLVAPAAAIVSDLAAQPSLGVVIADMPTFFRYNKIVTAENEGRMAQQMNALWQRMDLPRAIDFRDRDTYVMSYGTFFWARVDAIEPLLALDIADEVPPEPLGANTILHCLERMLVYVAWARGYDFRIAPGRYVTPFVDTAVLNTRPRVESRLPAVARGDRARRIARRLLPARVANRLKEVLRGTVR